MKCVSHLPGEHGDVFLNREEVTAIIDMPAGKCCLLIGGRQVIVLATAAEASKAILGTRAAGPWPSTKAKVVDTPAEEGKRLGEVS